VPNWLEAEMLSVRGSTTLAAKTPITMDDDRGIVERGIRKEDIDQELTGYYRVQIHALTDVVLQARFHAQ
jgi:hypothetical protein